MRKLLGINIKFVHAPWSLSDVFNSFVLFECLKRFCSFSKVDIPLPATLESAWREKSSVHVNQRTLIVDAHKNWKKYKATSRQLMVPVLTFLAIVKKYNHTETESFRWSTTVKYEGGNKRNVWAILLQVNFNPSLASTLHSHLSKFTEHYRGHWERKAPQVADKERHIFFRICKLKLFYLLWISIWKRM